jgi:hypothetical protein
MVQEQQKARVKQRRGEGAAKERGLNKPVAKTTAKERGLNHAVVTRAAKGTGYTMRWCPSSKRARVKPVSGEDDSKTEQAKPAQAKETANRLRKNRGGEDARMRARRGSPPRRAGCASLA